MTTLIYSQFNKKILARLDEQSTKINVILYTGIDNHSDLCLKALFRWIIKEHYLNLQLFYHEVKLKICRISPDLNYETSCWFDFQFINLQYQYFLKMNYHTSNLSEQDNITAQPLHLIIEIWYSMFEIQFYIIFRLLSLNSEFDSQKRKIFNLLMTIWSKLLKVG